MSDFVYIATLNDTINGGVMCKVGRTVRPLKRESGLRAEFGLYSDARMFMIFPCHGHSRLVERDVHRMMRANFQEGGTSELFRCAPEQAVPFLERALETAIRQASEIMDREITRNQLNRAFGPRSKPRGNA